MEDDEEAGIVRVTAAAEELPSALDSCFCRTWVINVLGSLQRKGIRLYGEPGKWEAKRFRQHNKQWGI